MYSWYVRTCQLELPSVKSSCIARLQPTPNWRHVTGGRWHSLFCLLLILIYLICFSFESALSRLPPSPIHQAWQQSLHHRSQRHSFQGRPLSSLLSTLRFLLSIRIYLLKWFVGSRHVAIIIDSFQKLIILLHKLIRDLLFLFSDNIFIVFEQLWRFFLRGCLAQLPSCRSISARWGILEVLTRLLSRLIPLLRRLVQKGSHHALAIVLWGCWVLVLEN